MYLSNELYYFFPTRVSIMPMIKIITLIMVGVQLAELTAMSSPKKEKLSLLLKALSP